MAKIRTIKPQFWLNESLAECTPSARLFYIGLWNFVDDDKGVFQWKPNRLKAQIFPYDNIKVEKLLQELVDIGVIKQFQYEGQEYGYIPSFSNHQKIDKRFFRSIVPEESLPDVNTASTPRAHHAGMEVEVECNGGGGEESLSDFEKTLQDFSDMRKKIKAPMTEYAIKLLLKKLDTMSGGNDNIKIQILEQSIMNSWKGVFELKEGGSTEQKKREFKSYN